MKTFYEQKFKKAIEEKTKVLDESYNKQKNQYEKLMRYERDQGVSEEIAQKKVLTKMSKYSEYSKKVTKDLQHQHMLKSQEE